MRITKCEQGHFYDADTYETCLHCINRMPRNEALKDMCAKKRRENENLISMCYKLLDILNGLIKEGTVLSEQIEPVIEQGQHVLGILTRTDNGFYKLHCLDDTSFTNDDDIKKNIEIERELLLVLRDFDSLDVLMEGFIFDSRRMIENWCKRKWWKRKYKFDFDSFLQEYQGFSSSISCELIPALEEVIQQLSDRIKLVSIACVYASPEVMGKIDYINETTDTYPLIHSKFLGEENNVRFCMYCGQSLTEQTQFCNKCGSYPERTVDLYATMRLCSSCGKSIPLISTFCPFCGRQVRITSVQNKTPMAEVYASPEMMKKLKFK